MVSNGYKRNFYKKIICMDQGKLLDRIRQGDQNAFRQIVEAYYPMVLKTSNGFVHNEEDAQDISQDVFLEVYRSVQKFRGDSEVSTWVYRIAVNKSLNFIRSKKRKQYWGSMEMITGRLAASDQSLANNPGDSPDNPENKERKEILYNSIDSLPKNQRIAFTLNKINEMSYKEVAAVMDVSLPSVESLIHRARKNLQKKLFRYYEKKIK